MSCKSLKCNLSLFGATFIFSVPIPRHKSGFSHVNVFFTPLWSKIKNSGRAGSGREDRLEKIITK